MVTPCWTLYLSTNNEVCEKNGGQSLILIRSSTVAEGVLSSVCKFDLYLQVEDYGKHGSKCKDP